jgi:hypothetical protein
MRILPCMLVVALVAPAAAKKMDPLMVTLRNLSDAAKCDDKASPWRPWCIAATGWSSGTAAELPAGKVLLGITIELEDGKDVATALSDSVSLSAFAVGKDGKVKLMTVKPTNDDETKSTAEAVFELSALLKGKTKVAKVPKDLASYLGGLKGAYPAIKSGAGLWTWEGASAGRARKVGTSWVVIATPEKANGYLVTVLTDAWTSK